MLTVGVAVAMAHADSARTKPLAMYHPAATLSVCSVFPAFSTLERHPLCCHLTVIAA
jgi:hypothetical protein